MRTTRITQVSADCFVHLSSKFSTLQASPLCWFTHSQNMIYIRNFRQWSVCVSVFRNVLAVTCVATRIIQFPAVCLFTFESHIFIVSKRILFSSSLEICCSAFNLLQVCFSWTKGLEIFRFGFWLLFKTRILTRCIRIWTQQGQQAAKAWWNLAFRLAVQFLSF